MKHIRDDNRTKEIQAVTMSISRNGTLGLFSGPYNILLLNMDDTKTKKKIPINKSVEPTTCQWNKCSNDTFAVTMNGLCKIYDVDMNKIQSLKGHNKPISSIDWHPMMANQIATTSIDSTKSLCIWDIRNSKTPTSRVDTLGIQQFKWNKVKSHVFATSFNAEIRLWDDRKLSSPVSIVAAHAGPINDFDWHPDEINTLVSCGQDKKIKIWNFLEGFSRPSAEYDEDVRFSRCKFDPVGNIMTLVASDVPIENHVAYWDFDDFSKLCQTPLSANVITNFELRNVCLESFQFVTLHRNSDFKIWQIDKATSFSKSKRRTSYIASFENSVPNDRFFLSPTPDISFNNSKAIPVGHSGTLAAVFKNDQPINILTHHSDPNLITRDKATFLAFDDQELLCREFDKLINTNQIHYEKNLDTKCVTAHLTLVHIKCSIQFIYRSSVGDNIFLDVAVLPGRAEKIRPQNVEELEKILKATADDYRCNNVQPIEKCVDVALEFLNKLSSRFSLRAIRSLKDQVNPYCNLPDVRVPFPRICGATFSPSGHLVCFIAPQGYMNRFHSTPRSLADITKATNPNTSGKSFFHDFNALNNKSNPLKQLHKTSIRKLKSSEFNIETSGRKISAQSIQKPSYLVIVYQMLQLSLFSPTLARKYSIDISDIEAMCQKNGLAVAESNRKDLVEFWQFCGILASGCKPSLHQFNSQNKPWSSQLMNRNLCKMWMEHFIKLSDIQSAAMLILVMRAIDTDLELFLEENFNVSSLSLTAGNHKNVSQESLMDNMNQDNMSPIVCVSVFYDGSKVFKLYDDNRNSTVIVSGTSENSPVRYRSNSNNENDHVLPEVILQHNKHCRLIDPAMIGQYSRILLHYIHMVSAQNRLSVAARIIQKIMPVAFITYLSSQYNFTVHLLKNCSHDHRCRNVFVDDVRSTVICSDCPPRNMSIHSQDLVIRSPIVCSICRMYVRGLFSLCAQCNHGGHIDHIKSWFSRSGSQQLCPTGCGCFCLLGKDNIHEISLPISAM